LLLRTIGNINESEAQLNIAKEIYTLLSSKSPILIGTILQHYSILELSRQKYNKASEYLKEAYEIKSKHLKKDHIHLSFILYDQSLICYFQKNNEQAKIYLDQAISHLSTLVENQDPEHPHLKSLLELKKLL